MAGLFPLSQGRGHRRFQTRNFSILKLVRPRPLPIPLKECVSGGGGGRVAGLFTLSQGRGHRRFQTRNFSILKLVRPPPPPLLTGHYELDGSTFYLSLIFYTYSSLFSSLIHSRRPRIYLHAHIPNDIMYALQPIIKIAGSW